ncbi:MAG TPA: hypothetical protein VE593_11320 [Nitrososphaeraceae archaeon]|nr:hypothetical protein [Nitrososphaeraceae archaeon]
MSIVLQNGPAAANAGFELNNTPPKANVDNAIVVTKERIFVIVA